jgi:energy-coupling factor transport system substrate-specific component
MKFRGVVEEKKVNKKLEAKDFITVGLFTALLFVVEFACGILGFIHPYIVASYVVMIPLVGAIPMMLFYTKIDKFGMISIMSVLLAIIMFVTGMGYLGAPLIIAAGVIADFVAKSGDYKDFKKIAISYGIFCLWICANYFPVIVSAKSYRQDLLDGGYTAEYCDSLFRAINSKTIAVLLVLCLLFGFLGAFLGKAVVRKHFEKAGIA